MYALILLKNGTYKICNYAKIKESKKSTCTIFLDGQRTSKGRILARNGKHLFLSSF